MSVSLFRSIQRFADLQPADCAALRKILPLIQPRFHGIVEDFYEEIQRHEVTRQILGDSRQVQRLKASLSTWLKEVFEGPHDTAYYEKRNRIGLQHVRVGLPQAFVFAAMSRVRRHLQSAVMELPESEADLRRTAFMAISKALDVDLAIIAGSYHEAEKYRDLIELAPEMIHQLDPQGRFLTVNQTELRRLGYSHEELLGTKLEDLVPREDLEAVRKHLNTVLALGESRCEVRLRSSRGELIDVEILATGVRDALTGRVDRIRSYVRDVIERKRAEEALRQERDTAQRYLDIAGAMICVTGIDGKLLLMNRKGCQVLGYQEEEVVGRHYTHFLPERIHEGAAARLAELRAGAAEAEKADELPLLTRAGEERILELHNTVLRDAEGNVTGILSSGVDVTDRRRMEKTLIEQASLARLGEMATIVAHEVKNPLAGIGGALQVIARTLPKDTESLPVIHEILARLAALNETVDDLLLYSRPRLPQRIVLPIVCLVQDVVSLVQRDPELRGVKVEIEGAETSVLGDPELLKPAFLNVILNAAQAMGGTGSIRILVEHQRTRCWVAIRDSGPGIPLELREKVFEPFFSTKHRGTGLGLAITRRIVEAHQGTIRFECPAEGGTVVTVELPLAR
ncbi:MAG TPA: PAS domain S-box protein [Planctomycetota bacterium]|nr:PAS domain S-box protein [Planctomycetota bacterium]